MDLLTFTLPAVCQIESVSTLERRRNSSETDRKCTEEPDILRTDVMAGSLGVDISIVQEQVGRP